MDIENEDIKIFWGMKIQTDHMIALKKNKENA